MSLLLAGNIASVSLLGGMEMRLFVFMQVLGEAHQDVNSLKFSLLMH